MSADAKGLSLVSDVQPDVPARVYGDAGRLRQVLLNLIGNAIKFTAHGQVSVAIERSTEAQDALHFAVRDSGIGIPADKQAMIFEAFTQVDGSYTRRFGGTGLGLTIASRLVRMMERTHLGGKQRRRRQHISFHRPAGRRPARTILGLLSCKPVSVPRRAAIIPLGKALLPSSSNLPGSRTERAAPPPLFGLAPHGVFPARWIAPSAVRSYRTFSPLPKARLALGHPAVYFLWH